LKFFFHSIVIGDHGARKERREPGKQRLLRQSCLQGIEFQKKLVLGQISGFGMIAALTVPSAPDDNQAEHGA